VKCHENQSFIRACRESGEHPRAGNGCSDFLLSRRTHVSSSIQMRTDTLVRVWAKYIDTHSTMLQTSILQLLSNSLADVTVLQM
jgi:hypothetical protein